MGNTFYFDWEITLIEWFQSHCSEALITIFSFITLFGEELVMILILGFLYWGYDKKYARFVGTNAVVGVVLNPLVKNVFLRRRPYFDNKTIKCLKPVEAEYDIYDVAAQGYSFPSGHSMNSAIVYPSIAIYGKKKILTILAIILPLLVGLSRPVVGVHYPTDVLVGWLLGALVVGLVSFLQAKISDKRILYLILAIVGLPGMFYCTSNDYYTAYGLMLGFFVAVLFEEKYVNFENTKNPLRILLRVVFGVLIYFTLNTVLKLPFSKQFLESGEKAALIVRMVRYFIDIFIMLGIYPMLFKYTDKLWDKDNRLANK